MLPIQFSEGALCARCLTGVSLDFPDRETPTEENAHNVMPVGVDQVLTNYKAWLQACAFTAFTLEI